MEKSFKQWILMQESNQNVLYHGSNSEKMVGTLYANERDSGWFGSGFYLTAYPDYAKRWGKFIHKMIIPDGSYAEINVSDGYSKIEFLGDAEKANQMAGGKTGWIENEALWSEKFKSSLKQMGYIGVRVNQDNWKDLEVVVFDPSTIQAID